MTASNVTQVNRFPVNAGFTSGAKTQSTDDFSKVLAGQDASAADVSDKTAKKASSVEPVKEDSLKTKETDETNRTDTQETENVNEISDKDISENEVTDTEAVDETDKLTEEEVTAVLEAITAMVNEISQVLNVSPEQVSDALEKLNLNPEDVLNPEAIPKLVVALTEGADELSLMTNENVFADVSKLMESAKGLLQQLSDELQVPMDDMQALLSKATEVNAEVPVELHTAVQTESLLTGTSDSPAPQTNLQIADNQTTEAKNETANGNSSKEDTAGGGQEQMNFSQNVMENIKAAVARTESASASYVSTTESIMNQIDDMIKVIQKQDLTEMELQLHPASLGNVRVQLSAKEGLVTASFTAENEAVRAALESQIVVLKQNFEEQGIKVEAVEVTVASHAFEENLSNSENGSNGEMQDQKPRTRKLSLNEIMNSDMMDELPEEERVVADMMMRNGNTVDYLA